jgi:hypothetical protein
VVLHLLLFFACRARRNMREIEQLIQRQSKAFFKPYFVYFSERWKKSFETQREEERNWKTLHFCFHFTLYILFANQLRKGKLHVATIDVSFETKLWFAQYILERRKMVKEVQEIQEGDGSCQYCSCAQMTKADSGSDMCTCGHYFSDHIDWRWLTELIYHCHRTFPSLYSTTHSNASPSSFCDLVFLIFCSY